MQFRCLKAKLHNLNYQTIITIYLSSTFFATAEKVVGFGFVAATAAALVVATTLFVFLAVFAFFAVKIFVAIAIFFASFVCAGG